MLNESNGILLPHHSNKRLRGVNEKDEQRKFLFNTCAQSVCVSKEMPNHL